MDKKYWLFNLNTPSETKICNLHWLRKTTGMPWLSHLEVSSREDAWRRGVGGGGRGVSLVASYLVCVEKMEGL